MKSRTAESADEEHGGEHWHTGRRADETEHEHREDRPAHEQHTRPPVIRQCPETELRHRARELVAHRQLPDRLQRQIQLRNQERQQRREHVAVGIDYEVGRCGRPDRRMETQPLHDRSRPSRLSTRSRESSNSRTRSSIAASVSTPMPTPIDAATRTACSANALPGTSARMPRSVSAAAAAMASDAISTFVVVSASLPPSMPCNCRRNRITCTAALTIAASDVPSASPAYPMTRTSTRLSRTLATTEVTLAMTGMRLSRSA